MKVIALFNEYKDIIDNDNMIDRVLELFDIILNIIACENTTDKEKIDLYYDILDTFINDNIFSDYFEYNGKNSDRMQLILEKYF
jgi:hypothetical protein